MCAIVRDEQSYKIQQMVQLVRYMLAKVASVRNPLAANELLFKV
jgi:hypothetical protein